VDFDNFCEVLLFSCGELERADRSGNRINKHCVFIRIEILTGQNSRLPSN